jgi:SAM-dependent methyltransferase
MRRTVRILVFMDEMIILQFEENWRIDMKIDDSGMPEEFYWNSLFDIPLIVDWLHLKNISGPIIEIGCGYGTFTVPIAKGTTESIFSFDIEPTMIDATRRNLLQANIQTVQLIQKDILEEGTGITSYSSGMVLLFNILHFQERRRLLEESSRILQPGGIIAIIHWRKDIPTPRGPALHLRPDQKMILDSLAGLDLTFQGNCRILEPYHWGMKLRKMNT